MRRRTGPVQQWVDSIPSPVKSNLAISAEPQEEKPDAVSDRPKMAVTPTEPKDIPFPKGSKTPRMTVSAPINVPGSPTVSTPGIPSSFPHSRLVRDPSLQSDSSHCSSVESLLELRRADPEAILLSLGFGGCSNSPQENGPLSRIPKRFLQPSKLKGIAITDFVKHQQETSESFDSVSLGYRGLTGSPYVAPSEIVQKIMERLREHESHEADAYHYDQYSPLQQTGRLSVLSPDNRQFLDRPRSKSPDMRNKRMIIGQKSFAFGCDGDLIEVSPRDTKESKPTNSDSENITKDIGTFPDLGNTNTEERDTSRKATTKTERILPKQLSFDDSMEYPDIINDITKDRSNNELESPLNREEPEPVPPEESKNEDDASFKHIPDHRRSSDGSCEVTFTENTSLLPRRLSDDLAQDTETQSDHFSVLNKRKVLKRQPRVSDMDAIRYCNSSLELSEDERPETSTMLSVKEHAPEDTSNRTSRLRTSLSSESTSNEAHVEESIERSRSKSLDAFSSLEIHECAQKANSLTSERTGDCCRTEQSWLCCYKGPSTRACTGDGTCEDCCCRTDNPNCWKKMEKIMQENKKLEDMVAKSRKEMAEIRDMLNSVLSVRMEPGF